MVRFVKFSHLFLHVISVAEFSDSHASFFKKIFGYGNDYSHEQWTEETLKKRISCF